MTPKQERWIRRVLLILVIAMILAVLVIPTLRGWLNANEGAIASLVSLLLVVLYFGL